MILTLFAVALRRSAELAKHEIAGTGTAQSPAASLALAALIASAGCTLQAEFPDGAQVECENDADCPGDLVCSSDIDRCVEPGASLERPALSALTVTPARVRAGDTVEFELRFTKELAQTPTVSLLWSDDGEPVVRELQGPTLAGDTWTTRYTAGAGDASSEVAEVFASVLVEGVDRDGLSLRVERPRELAFDYRPPGVVANSITVISVIGPSNPLRQIGVVESASLRPDRTATILFTVNEDLGRSPVPRIISPVNRELELLSEAGRSYSARLKVLASDGEGRYDVEVLLVDEVGNESVVAVPLEPALSADTQAPIAPDTSSMSVAHYRREPWGRNGSSPSFTLQGAVDACGAECPYVIVFSEPDTENASVLGGERVQPDGSYGPLQLIRADRPAVYLALADGAGNLSDADALTPGAQAGLVAHGTWVASLGGKETSDRVRNPHVVYRASAYRRVLRESQQLPQSFRELSSEEYDSIGAADASLLRVDSAVGWLRGGSPVNPPARRAPAAYDSERSVMVLYGGAEFEPVSGLWEFDGRRWLGRDANAPGARFGHGLTFFPDLGATLLFGGNDSSELGNLYDDRTWTWDGTVWTPLSLQARPQGRFLHAMTHDPFRGQIVMFGGRDGSGEPTRCANASNGRCGDTWLFGEFGEAVCGEATLYCWQEVTPPVLSDSPPARLEPALGFDPSSGDVILFGGSQLNPSVPCDGASSLCNDTWRWDGTGWFPVVSSVVPDPRRGATMVTDYGDGVLRMFGGFGESGCGGGSSTLCADGFVYTAGVGWESDATTGLLPRYSPASAYHDARQAVVAFSGFSEAECVEGGTGQCRDTVLREGSEWTTIAQPGLNPLNNGFARTASYDPGLDAIVLFQNEAFFAGSQQACEASFPSNCLQTFLRRGGSWQRVGDVTEPNPVPRFGGAMVYREDSGTSFLYGGRRFSGQNDSCDGVSEVCNDVWELGSFGTCPAGSDVCWASRGAAAPGRRYAHDMAYLATEGWVVMFGGADDNDAFLGDTWLYGSSRVVDCPTRASCWDAVATPAAPSARSGHVMAFDPVREQVVLFGGEDATGLRQDTWVFGNFRTCAIAPCWQELSTSSAPSPRRNASMVFDPVRQGLVLYGGAPASDADRCWANEAAFEGCSDVWRLRDGEWSEVAIAGTPPLGRAGAALVSTDDGLLMLGGVVDDRDSAGRAIENILPHPTRLPPAIEARFSWLAASVPAQSVTSTRVEAVAGGAGAAPGTALDVWRSDTGLAELRATNSGSVSAPEALSTLLEGPLTPWIDRRSELRLVIRAQPGDSLTTAPAVTLDALELVVDYVLPEP